MPDSKLGAPAEVHCIHNKGHSLEKDQECSRRKEVKGTRAGETLTLSQSTSKDARPLQDIPLLRLSLSSFITFFHRNILKWLIQVVLPLNLDLMTLPPLSYGQRNRMSFLY